MQSFTSDEIREKFLSFFEQRGHYRLPSFPLVPINDKSLLLINSGMAPLKPYFTGQEVPPSKRVVTCQKCIRTNDIDEVGTDARHGSFFEMLGNFSFGDYFKKEIIPWSWEFLTDVLQIPKDKLYVSIHTTDDEAFDIWRNGAGLPEDRIVRLEDNFWEVGNGVGPCGPDSEIHFDRGAEYGCGKPTCGVGCDCDRFMELWNLVFTQYDQQPDGSYKPLSQKNIDTGMGLERVAVVMQRAESFFEIDTMKRIKESVVKLLPSKDSASEVSLNIIADHMRSCAFMASDGVLPSNEGRGYVLRRLLRRAVRHGRLTGIKGAFISEVLQTVIDVFKAAYPLLSEKSKHIIQALSTEEARFLETLDTGLGMLRRKIDEMKQNDETVLTGADAFKLYDTFGFPPELTRELLADEGLTLDGDGFTVEMKAQKARARAARETTGYMGAEETVFHKLPAGLKTEFTGYTESEAEAKVLAIVADGEIADEAHEGQNVAVVLSRTSLYAESGGQAGDRGSLINAGVRITVTDVKKAAGNNTAHFGTVETGTVRVGDKLTAAYDIKNRRATMRNHSATHLLQKALRTVLGDHVEQAGSNVNSARLRFDFTHFSPMTNAEKERVAEIVNASILDALSVNITETTPDEARKKGATALFGEKYGSTVRLVDMGGWSMELCGGTHVSNTSQIGLFKLVSETGVSSGVRRIEAVTGDEALRQYKEAEERLGKIAALVKTTPDGKLTERLDFILNDYRQLKKAVSKQSAGANAADVDEVMKKSEAVNNFNLVSGAFENISTEDLRELSDKIKSRINSGALFLCAVNEGAVQFIASATDDAVKKGVNCGQLVKAAAVLCGGGGGGRPNHAQAGGKDAGKVKEAMEQAVLTLKGILVN